MLTCCSITAFDITNFHGIRQHAGEAERYTLGVFLAVHGDFETVTEINVHNLSGHAVEHEIGRVAIAQTKNVPDHGHDGKRACVVGTTIEPGFRRFGLEPEHAVEILAGGVVQRVAKDFNLLHECETVVVRRHL